MIKIHSPPSEGSYLGIEKQCAENVTDAEQRLALTAMSLSKDPVDNDVIQEFFAEVGFPEHMLEEFASMVKFKIVANGAYSTKSTVTLKEDPVGDIKKAVRLTFSFCRQDGIPFFHYSFWFDHHGWYYREEKGSIAV